MRRKVILVICLALSLAASAHGVWTMDSCIAYALEHSADVQLKALALKCAKADKVQSAAEFLPAISGQISGQFSWGRGIDPETNTYTNITNFSTSQGIYASWTTFDGGRTLYNWKQACVAQRQAKNNMQLARDNKAVEVMQAFISAVYAEGCHTLARQRLAEVEQELRKARVQEEIGTMSRPDVALIEAQMAEAEYELVRQEGEEERTKRLLALAMALPQASLAGEGTCQLLLSTDGLAIDERDNENHSSAGEGSGEVLPAAVAAALDLEQARLQRKVAGSYLWPTLSLGAGISTGYYTTIGNGAQGRSFGEQWRNNMGRYVTATISFPVFGNLSRLTSLKKAKYNLVSATIQRDETLRRLDHEMLQAEADCRQGTKEVDALAGKVAADSLAYTLNTKRFEEGLVTAQDLVTASRELQDARVKLLQARLTLIMRRRLANYYHTGSITSR